MNLSESEDVSESPSKVPSANWNECPPEIYSMIFNYLQPKDLIPCLFVNRTWRAILENDVYINWELVAKIILPDEGVDMKRKSKLNWRGVVFKNGVWSYGIDQLKVALLHEYKSQEDYRPALVIYRDKLYVSTRKHSECIDIESRGCIRMEESCKDMYLYDESDHIRLLYDGAYKLRLVGKKSFDDTTSCPEATFCFEATSPLVFLLEEDCCYIFEDNKYLKVFIWEDQTWQSKWVARYYGSTEFNTMTVYKNQVFLLGRHGDLWRVALEDHQFKKAVSFKTPPFYHQANSKALLRTLLTDYETSSYFQKKDLSSIFVKGVTCATHHAGILFLAYSNGQIEAWILKKNIHSPNFYYNPERFTSLASKLDYYNYCSAMSSIYGEPNSTDLKRKHFCERRFDVLRVYDCIYNMVIYEGETSCYLFINCGHSIYQYQLKFPGFV